jgi:hypothetical protein
MQSRPQFPAAAVQPAGHAGIVSVCLVNEVLPTVPGGFPHPALIPIRIPASGFTPLEPLDEPLAVPEPPAPLALTPDVAVPLAAPDVPPVPLAAPDVPPALTPEPPSVPLVALPLVLEPVPPPAALAPEPEPTPSPLDEPLPMPPTLVPLLEPELAPLPPALSGEPLQATAVKSAPHGSVRSQYL